LPRQALLMLDWHMIRIFMDKNLVFSRDYINAL